MCVSCLSRFSLDVCLWTSFLKWLLKYKHPKHPKQIPSYLGGFVSNGPPTLIHSPHLLVRATNERFLSSGDTFRASLASESHWLQPVMVLSVHW